MRECALRTCSPSPNPRSKGRCVCCDREVDVKPAAERNPDVEREFLRNAERVAGLDIDWADRVKDRVLRMERSKGKDSYKQLGFWRCVSETEEECLDLGGWPMMAFLLSHTEFSDDDERGLEARMILQQIAAHGVRVSGLIGRLRELRD